MQVIGDEHVTEVGVVPYNIFKVSESTSDPLGNLGEEHPDGNADSRVTNPWGLGGAAEEARP